MHTSPLLRELETIKVWYITVVTSVISSEGTKQVTPKYFLRLGTTNLIDATGLGPRPKTNPSADRFQYHVHYIGSDIA